MAQLDIAAKPRVCLSNKRPPRQKHLNDQPYDATRKPSSEKATSQDDLVVISKLDTSMNPELTTLSTSNTSPCPRTQAAKVSPSGGHRRVIFPTLYEDNDSKVQTTTEVQPALSHRRVPSLDSFVKKSMLMVPFSPKPKKAAPQNIPVGNGCIGQLTVDGLPVFPNLAIPCFVPRKRTASISQSSPNEKRPDQRCFQRSQSDTTNDQLAPIQPYHPPRLHIFPRQQQRQMLRKSILKAKPFALSRNEVSSEESIPSLASSAASDDECHELKKNTKSSMGGKGRAVSFDPRVWITEFTRSRDERACTWYSSVEMDRFKRAAIDRVCRINTTQFVATGTGRLVRRPNAKCKALFTNPALTLDGEDDDDEISIQRLAKAEMQTVLIVDPHDICLRLFGRAIKAMFPHVVITTARSSEEATKRMMKQQRFDMVIVEERLGLFHGKGDQKTVSGSALIQLLASQGGSIEEGGGCGTLWVAVSAHFQADEERMNASGADFQWPKPPPNMNLEMRDTLMKALLMKRGKEQTALTYFGL